MSSTGGFASPSSWEESAKCSSRAKTAICPALAANSGHRIWYCNGASVRHRTGGERLTPEYIVRQKYWFGISYAVIDRRIHGPVKQAFLALARLSKLVLLSGPLYYLARLSGDRPAELLARCSIAKQWGYVRATVIPIHVSSEFRKPREPGHRGHILTTYCVR